MKLPKLKIKKKLLIGITTLTVFSVIGLAVAQELQRTFTVINPAISYTVNPGDKLSGTTSVINDSTVPLTFNLGVQDYVVSNNYGIPNLLPPGTLNSKYSAAAWIGVDPSNFTLNPQQTQKLNYYIQVPLNAAPCGHYAAIVYTPATKIGQGTGTTVSTQIGSLFYLTVNGTCKESARVTKFTSNPFQEYGPVNILTEIKNDSDIHIMPKGNISLSGLFANSSYKLPQNNIFPQISRDYQNSVGQNFMIGQYKAVLLASYGINNNLPLTATLYFWVFPWRLALVIAFVIIAVILLIVYLGKKKKVSPKAPEEPKEKAESPVEEEKK